MLLCLYYQNSPPAVNPQTRLPLPVFFIKLCCCAEVSGLSGQVSGQVSELSGQVSGQVSGQRFPRRTLFHAPPHSRSTEGKAHD